MSLVSDWAGLCVGTFCQLTIDPLGVTFFYFRLAFKSAGCGVEVYIFLIFFLPDCFVTEVHYFLYLFVEGVGGVIRYEGEVVVMDELLCLRDFLSKYQITMVLPLPALSVVAQFSCGLILILLMVRSSVFVFRVQECLLLNNLYRCSMLCAIRFLV